MILVKKICSVVDIFYPIQNFQAMRHPTSQKLSNPNGHLLRPSEDLALLGPTMTVPDAEHPVGAADVPQVPEQRDLAGIGRHVGVHLGREELLCISDIPSRSH